MKYYLLKNKEVNWGDYGDILLSGMTSSLERQEGYLQLERTGPFQPKIIISGIGDLIVTGTFKSKLQDEGLEGLNFKPVIKRHIAFVDWITWDLQAEDPEFYPDSGEPEDYILALPHSENTANQMEDVWEVIVSGNGKLTDNRKFVPNDTLFELMRVENSGWLVVTEKMKGWLNQNQADWLDFDEIENE